MFCPSVIPRKWSPLLYYPLLIIVLLRSPKWGNYVCARSVGDRVHAPAHARMCVSTIYCNIFSNSHSVNCFSVTSCLSLSLLFSYCSQKKLSTLNEIWRKTYVEILWFLSIAVFEDWFCCFCLHAHCSVPNAAHCNLHQVIVINVDLFCLLAQPPQTWKCGKYATIDLPAELKIDWIEDFVCCAWRFCSRKWSVDTVLSSLSDQANVVSETTVKSRAFKGSKHGSQR